MHFSKYPARLHFLAAFCLFAPAMFAQSVPQPAQTPPASATIPKLDYPDSAGGLEHLAKEILQAQKDGDSARASALAASLILPDAAAWYAQTFGPRIADVEGAQYVDDQKNVAPRILSFFFEALQRNFTEVTAARFADTCDDNAGESAFGTLQLRLQPTPLYELRFHNGHQFLRLFAFAYVDGAFRFVLAPKISTYFPELMPGHAPLSSPATPPVHTDANVTAASLIKRVQPQYPEKARNERLQGTVRLHAIIGKDGSVVHLIVLSGYCSLAQASMDAVSRWRYKPTMVNGDPVEVDTTIDVIFSLRR